MQNLTSPGYRPPPPAQYRPGESPQDKAKVDAYNNQPHYPPQTYPTPKAVAPPAAGAAPGAPAPTWVPYSAPGYAEDYYNQHKGFYDQPGQASQYWEGVKGFFNTPQQSETDLSRYGKQLGATPGVSETRYADNARAGAYDQPGAAESFWNTYGSGMMAPSAGEDALGRTLESLRAPGAAEDYYAQHGQEFATPGALESLFPQLRNDLSRYSQSELLAQGYKPEASYAEDFLTGGGAGEGLDQMYNRLYAQGSRKLGDEGAARGTYNSGASLRASEELNADLTGRHVQDLQAATNAADAAKMARLGYGLNVMKASDESMLGREQGLLAAGGQTQEAMKNRLLAGGTLASSAETGMLGRMKETTDAGIGLGNLVRQRYTAGSEASDRAQKAAHDRFEAGSVAASRSERDAMDRITAAGGLERDSTQLALNRLAGGREGATAAGNEDILRVTSGQNAAKVAQDSKEGRESGVLKNLMDVANSQAGTYAKMTDQQRSEELQTKMTEIDGLLKRGQISASEADQMRNMYSQLLGAPIAAAGRGTPTPGATSSPKDPNYLLPMSG